MKIFRLPALFVLVTFSATAQVTLLKDIATQPASVTEGSQPNLTTVNSGNFTYFLRRSDKVFEIWRTDGTSEGTIKVTESNPNIIDFNGSLLFTKDNSLYKTTGTTASIEKIKDVSTINSPYYTDIQFIAQFDGKMFFTATSYAPFVGELWATDGTTNGTNRVTSFDPSPSTGVYTVNAKATSDHLFFTLYYWGPNQEQNHNEVWRTDGTEGGTISLTQIDMSYRPLVNAVVDNKLVFNKPNGSGGSTEVWTSDGTVLGTTLLKEFGSEEVTFVQDDDRVFILTSWIAPFEEAGIYVTDGTEVGTKLLYNTESYKRSGIMNGLFYSLLQNCTLVTSDGTPEGTSDDPSPNCSQIYTSPADFDPSFTVLNDHFLILYYSEETGSELGWSDGTWGGTTLIKDIVPGTGSSYPSSFIQLPGQNKVIFFAEDDHGRELWVTDGTADGTHIIKDIVPGTESSLDVYDDFIFASTKDHLYFRSFDNTQVFAGKRALWRTDGTAEGTTLNYPFENYVKFIGLSHDDMIFYDYKKFLKLDGMDNSSPILKEAPDANSTTGAFSVTLPNNILLYPLASDATGLEFWVTDGSENGTHLLKDINPGSASALIALQTFSVLNSKAAFAATDATHGTEPWITDGTEANTMMLLDINPGSGASSPGPFASTATETFFTADDGVHGVELWKSDGTPAGTVMVKDALPAGAMVTDIIATTGTVYFSAYVDDEVQLWQSDGTSDGTEKVANFQSYLFDLNTVVDGKLLFTATDVEHGTEPWILDSNGPRVLDIVEGAPSSKPELFTTIGGFIYFKANNKIYRTAGSPDDVDHVADYSPLAMTLFNDEIYFVARSAEYGIEVFKMPFERYEQDITMDEIADKTMGDPDFDVHGEASSGGEVTFTSNDKVTIDGSSVTLAKPGVASITAHAGDGLYEDVEVTNTFCVNPAKPTITATNPGTNEMALVSSATSGNEWFKDGAPVTGQGDPTLLITEPGSYTVQSNVEGCIGALSEPFAVVVTGIENVESLLKIYPNPASKELSIEWNGGDKVELEVINIHGQKIYETQFHNSHKLDLSSWSTDIYILKLQVNDNVLWKKVVKQ